VLQLLPREIRDIVYEYLCSGANLNLKVTSVQCVEHWVWNDDFFERSQEGKSKQKKVQERSNRYVDRVNSPLPHFCSSDYVDGSFVQEVGPIFYKYAAFSLESHDDMEAFLTQDILRMGCCPKDHVRRVDVVLPKYRDGGIFPLGIPLTAAEVQEQIQNLHAILSTVKYQKDFQLDLRHEIWNDDEGYGINTYRFRELLVPCVRKLQSEGFVVRLRNDFRGGWNRNGLLGLGPHGAPRIVDNDVLQAWESQSIVFN